MHTDYPAGSESTGPKSTGVEVFFLDFSEKGLRSQVEWSIKHLDLTDGYYSNMLHIKQRRFEVWRQEARGLREQEQDVLKAFWQLNLHLRTFYNGDIEAIRAFYEHVPPRKSEHADPPWSGTSIKRYIEAEGKPAIEAVQIWFETLGILRPY